MTEGTSGTRTSCGAAWIGESATSFSGKLRRKRNRGGGERQGQEWREDVPDSGCLLRSVSTTEQTSRFAAVSILLRR